MSPKLSLLFLAFLAFVSAAPALAKSIPTSNPQALQLAAQSIAAMSGGNSIADVTLTGSATWTAGSDTETGSVTFLASGNGESRLDLILSNGTRTEIRDTSTGVTKGKWSVPSGTSGLFAFHNCQTDAVWFFPVLGSLAVNPNVVMSYVGQESRNSASVQHIQSYVYQPSPTSGLGLQQLSTMDFYLDTTTLLPSVIVFNAHPDNNAGSNIPVEIDFSNYQTVNGVVVPMHIQKYVQGTLMLDLTLSSAVFNTGISLSNFTIN